MKFKVGNKVKYKDEIGTLQESIFIVYGVYSKNEVSLGLRKYPNIEQDYLTNIKDIIKVN